MNFRLNNRCILKFNFVFEVRTYLNKFVEVLLEALCYEQATVLSRLHKLHLNISFVILRVINYFILRKSLTSFS